MSPATVFGEPYKPGNREDEELERGFFRLVDWWPAVLFVLWRWWKIDFGWLGDASGWAISHSLPLWIVALAVRWKKEIRAFMGVAGKWLSGAILERWPRASSPPPRPGLERFSAASLASFEAQNTEVRPDGPKFSLGSLVRGFANLFNLALKYWRLIACVLVMLFAWWVLSSIGGAFRSVWCALPFTCETKADLREQNAQLETENATLEVRADVTEVSIEEGARFHDTATDILAELARGNEQIQSVDAHETLAIFTAWRDADQRLCDQAGGCAG